MAESILEQTAKVEEANILATERANVTPCGTTAASVFFARELESIHECPPPTPEDIAPRLVYLGPQTKKYTLLLDLDETLVHTPDVALPIGTQWQDLVDVRPGAQELLSRLSEKYELVVFTAAEEAYAGEVMQRVDPEHKYVGRVLSRNNCIQTEQGFYAKDLSIFADRTLSNILIVDNSVYSFAFQLAHGIPIIPYYGSKEDSVLTALANYLDCLYLCSDVIHANREAIGLADLTS